MRCFKFIMDHKGHLVINPASKESTFFLEAELEEKMLEKDTDLKEQDLLNEKIKNWATICVKETETVSINYIKGFQNCLPTKIKPL